MKAVILAGGKGTRLHPVTGGKIPKPMAPLAGRPVLEHLIARLSESGVTEICCTLQCLPEQIEDYFGDGSAWGVRMEYRLEREPLGTAGAVRNCRDFCGEAPFLVLSGDGVFDFDLRPLEAARAARGACAALALYPQSDPLAYGLTLTDGRGLVRGFIEKPLWSRVVTDLVNTGIYALHPRALDYIPADRPYDFARDLFPALLARGELIAGLPMEGYWRDIGEPAAYYRANLDALEGRLRLPRPAPAAPRKTVSTAPPPRRYSRSVTVATPRRARLMRELSAALMEAGADFTDGLTLAGAPGGLHIAPDPVAERLRIESDDEATLRRYEALARRLEEQTK